MPASAGDDRGVARGHDGDLARRDPATRCPDAGRPSSVDVDPRHLRALDQVDAEVAGGAGVRPRHVVVLGDPAARLIRRPEDRIADVGRDVDDRAQLADLLGREPFGVDPVEPVGVDAPLALADVTQVVRQVHHAALAEQQVVVELLGETLPELQPVLVDGGALVPQVVRADDRGVAGHVPAGQPAPLHDRHVRDPVVPGEVVGRREAMSTATDDDDVVRRLRLGATPQPVGVMRDVPVGAHAQARMRSPVGSQTGSLTTVAGSRSPNHSMRRAMSRRVASSTGSMTLVRQRPTQ